MKISTWVKAILIIVTSSFFTSTASAQIAGSVHDFSGEGWSNGEICLPCHTPHNADTTVVDSPLWNHEVTTATYTLYTSGSMQTAPEQPQGVTRLCLSCHDGTVALDSFGGNSGSNMLTGEANLGTALTDDHPVSILWQHQNRIMNGTCGNCHNLHNPNWPTPLPFFDRYIECATCHDVHNGTGYPSLLRLSMERSQLCFHCHGK